MLNPKIVIESDGERTEVYIDGKKLEGATYASFEHFTNRSPTWFAGGHKHDEKNIPVIENGELVEELFVEYPEGHNG